MASTLITDELHKISFASKTCCDFLATGNFTWLQYRVHLSGRQCDRTLQAHRATGDVTGRQMTSRGRRRSAARGGTSVQASAGHTSLSSTPRDVTYTVRGSVRRQPIAARPGATSRGGSTPSWFWCQGGAARLARTDNGFRARRVNAKHWRRRR